MHAHGYPWREFFWISLGIAALNVSYSLYAFRPTKEEFEMEKGQVIASDTLLWTNLAGRGDIENASQQSREKSEGQKGR